MSKARETLEEAGLDKSDLKLHDKNWILSYPVKEFIRYLI